MRKTFLSAVGLGVLSTAAMAATPSLTYISEAIVGAGPNGQTTSLVGGLSADGRFVGITRAWQRPSDLRWFDAPSVFDTSTNTYATLRLNSGNASTRGVEHINGVPLAIVAESNANAATWKKGTIESGVNTSGYMDGGAVGLTGNANAMAMDANGNGWMVGGTIASDQARAWQITAGAVNPTAAYQHQPYPGKNILNGVSHTGMAVGNWNDGSSDRAFLVNVAGGLQSTARRALNFGQISSSNTSQGNAVSSNGVWAGGYVNVDDANVLNGWRLEISPTFPAANPDPTLSDGIYTRLLPVGYDSARAQQSNVFDIADDGTAVGFSYDPATSYHATLWAAGSNQGVLVWDILAGLGVDLSGWEKLERVISISDDGLTIAGRGVRVGGAYGAFVAVIPEPTTIGLLALGGLMLRRRR